MKAALCLIANASEAGELAATLSGLRASGATIRVAAPREAVASVEALGVCVDHPLGGNEGHEGALARLIAVQAPAALMLSPRSALAAAATTARDAGVAVSFVSSTPAAAILALEDFVAAAKREVEEILPEEALRILEAPEREGWHFVDVREPDEYAAGHVPGARNSPRGFLEVRADLVHYKRDPWFEDRDRPMILYCGGGHRSALAVATLQRMGFTRLLSLGEGWTGWTERKHPVTLPPPPAQGADPA
jgi:rhodanese-related sulfurtransferase